MMWHVQYRKDAASHVARHPSPEQAIEAACRLFDDGYDVHGVGTGPLTDSIDREQIGRIYDVGESEISVRNCRLTPMRRISRPAAPVLGDVAAGREGWVARRLSLCSKTSAWT